MIQGTNYDWIVVGGGLCGVTLAYELLQHQAGSVLLLDPNPLAPGATRYSYGGIPYWAGTTALTRQICRSAIAQYRSLAIGLEADIEFQERSLLLTIAPDQDPTAIAQTYSDFMVQPQLLSPEEALEREPLLNREAIAGALCLPHGHVSPLALVRAYRQAFERLGGQVVTGKMIGVRWQQSQAIGIDWLATTGGVIQSMGAAQVVIAAGAWSRLLLQQQGIDLPLYFTHAELIETERAPFQLQAIVMPAVQQRFQLEGKASSQNWQQADAMLQPPVLDAGVVQFADGHCCLGQISRLWTAMDEEVDAATSEEQMRQALAAVVPQAAQLSGHWYSTRVAFSGDGLPLIGSLPQRQGLFVFSGFSSPFVYVPPLAKRFARDWVAAQRQEASDPILQQFSPDRFKHSDQNSGLR